MIRGALTLVLAGALAWIQPAGPKPGAGESGRALFDGKTTDGWRGYRQQTMPAGWKVVDGALTRVGTAGDIVTLGEFENFELTLDWKIAPGANSGIFYRVVEHDDDTAMWMAAPEYQLIDDTGYPGTLKATQKTAANYDLQPPGRDATRPAGSWNTTRILVNGSHVEHWLNGVLIVSYELWSDEWNRLVAQSKFKDHPRYARARKGRIGIQDHGDWAAFRNIRIRELPATPQAPAPAPAADIWLRRTLDLPAGILAAPHLRVFHDDDAQVYLNGTLVADLAGANPGFAYVPLTGPARAALRAGKNTLAVHAHQTRGGQFIDVGLVDVGDPVAAR